MKRIVPLLLLASCSTGTYLDDGDSAVEPRNDGAVTTGDGGATSAVCDAELTAFRDDLWTPLLAVQCVGCHSAQGTAHLTRMVFRSETQPGWLEANYRAAELMVRNELAGVPLLLLRPSGQHPGGHTGGTLAPTGSMDYAALSRFVTHARNPQCGDAGLVNPTGDGGTTPTPTRCDTVSPGPRMLRRLTPAEYDRTVTDLLGAPSTYGARFVADTVVEGFDNHAASLVVTPLLADQLRVAAEALATQAATDFARLSPCMPTSATDAACARRFVESFGAKAFRRPLSVEEATRYTTLHTTVAMAESFRAGVEAVVSAMLQSPHFLYRSELGVAEGGAWRLTPWEVASELSYLLTGSMPDDMLFEAARNGGLSTPAGVEREARRLLATPGARDAMRRFVRQWLDVERIDSVPKDGATFPAFTPVVRASMRGEFDRYVDAVLSRPGATLPDLLTSSFTFVDSTLGAFYSLTPTGAADAQGFRRVDAVEAQRRGVLGLGAVMAVHGRSNSSSPVSRGRLVRERLLCQVLPPPPPGVNAQPPAPDPRRSLRDQYAAHSSMHPCVDCHRLIDPIGFTFEFFDGVGRYRAMENGMPIDGHGEVVGSRQTDGAVADARALVERLAASPEVHDCFARQLFRYAYAMAPSEQTACALAEVQQRFRGERLTVESLLVALTRSVHFTQRAGDGTSTTPTPDAGVDASADVMTAPDAMTPRDAATTPDVMTTPDVPTRPTATPGVTTMGVRDSTWDTGFCERVVVTNTTRAAVDWTVVYDIAGTVTNSWNSERTGDSGAVVFRGAMWNRTLNAGERTELGFCARR